MQTTTQRAGLIGRSARRISKLRPRSGYDVIAVIAMCAALGTGGAYAAVMVGSDEVIDESLLGQDIKNAGLTGLDLKDDSLTGADVQESALTGVKLSGLEVIEKTTVHDSSQSKGVVISCPVGKRVVGTGHVVHNLAAPSVQLWAVVLAWNATAVEFAAKEYTSELGSWRITGQVTCANAE